MLGCQYRLLRQLEYLGPSWHNTTYHRTLCFVFARDIMPPTTSPDIIPACQKPVIPSILNFSTSARQRHSELAKDIQKTQFSAHQKHRNSAPSRNPDT